MKFQSFDCLVALEFWKRQFSKTIFWILENCVSLVSSIVSKKVKKVRLESWNVTALTVVALYKRSFDLRVLEILTLYFFLRQWFSYFRFIFYFSPWVFSIFGTSYLGRVQMTKRALQFAAFRERRYVIGGGTFLRIIHRAWGSHQPAKRVRANLSVIVPTTCWLAGSKERLRTPRFQSFGNLELDFRSES